MLALSFGRWTVETSRPRLSSDSRLLSVDLRRGRSKVRPVEPSPISFAADFLFLQPLFFLPDHSLLPFYHPLFLFFFASVPLCCFRSSGSERLLAVISTVNHWLPFSHSLSPQLHHPTIGKVPPLSPTFHHFNPQPTTLHCPRVRLGWVYLSIQKFGGALTFSHSRRPSSEFMQSKSARSLLSSLPLGLYQ